MIPFLVRWALKHQFKARGTWYPGTMEGTGVLIDPGETHRWKNDEVP